MPSIKLSAEETAKRFGVNKTIEHFPSTLTKQEEANVKVVLEYMEVTSSLYSSHYVEFTGARFQIAYSPTNNKGASSVSHLCAPENTFLAPSTFPEAHTAEEYAQSHSKVMSALSDLHIIQFDVVVAKGGFSACYLVLKMSITYVVLQRISFPSGTLRPAHTTADRITTSSRLIAKPSGPLPGTSSLMRRRAKFNTGGRIGIRCRVRVCFFIPI